MVCAGVAVEGTGGGQRRLAWIDVLKGLSILWIVYFHLFEAADQGRSLDPLAPDLAGRIAAQCTADAGWRFAACVVRGAGVAVVMVGYHAVSVFLLLAGFGLARSLGDAPAPPTGWAAWYRRRLLRLYPLYWAAHLLLAVSPFTFQPEPIDYRFALSFVGIRCWPIDSMHFYFNPAWWYFALLVQLYAVFPLLWGLQRRLGPAGFAGAGVAISALVRLAMFTVWPVHPFWAQGAFFASRMAEFAIGMALGVWHRRDPRRTEAVVFHPLGLGAGVAIYAAGILSFRALWSYCVTDALIGVGLSLVTAHAAHAVLRWRFGGALLATVGTYSYGLYLLHQPYVLYAGPRWHDLDTLPYLVASTALVTILFVCSATIERGVAFLADRVLG